MKLIVVELDTRRHLVRRTNHDGLFLLACSDGTGEG